MRNRRGTREEKGKTLSKAKATAKKNQNILSRPFSVFSKLK
jgi:hypothetical protein